MPVLARAFLLISLVLTVLGGLLIGIATRRVTRTHDIPPPPISRATDPGEVARGGRLFRTNCLPCHGGQVVAPSGVDHASPGAVPPVVVAASGGRVMGTPSFMGEIWAPNLTADRETGIGDWSDGALARLLRNGLDRDGRYAATMPRFARLGDADVAALIGFLRSNDPLVAPRPNRVPRPGLSLAGTLALAFAAGVDTRGEPRVVMPARGPTAAYGGYLAASVYACVDCHTEGFGTTDEKLRSPVLLAGGQFHRTPDGETIYSTNLTPDPETGLGTQTRADLEHLLTTGIGHAGIPARPPMPVFRNLDAEESAALFAYLRSVPAVARKTPGATREAPTPTAEPERLFSTLGCGVCHGERAPHQARLDEQAAALSAMELAETIRHPETRNPASQMPSYASVLDQTTSLRLAEWIRAEWPRRALAARRHPHAEGPSLE